MNNKKNNESKSRFNYGDFKLIKMHLKNVMRTFHVMLSGIGTLRRRLILMQISIMRRDNIKDNRRWCLDILVVGPEPVLLHSHLDREPLNNKLTKQET